MTGITLQAAVVGRCADLVAAMGDVQAYCRHTSECMDRVRVREADDCTCGWAEAMERLNAAGDALLAACEAMREGDS